MALGSTDGTWYKCDSRDGAAKQVRLLQQRGAHITCKDRHGASPLDAAAQNGPSSTIRVPLFAARTLNATDQSRVTLSLW